jgi:hypothetical protein
MRIRPARLAQRHAAQENGHHLLRFLCEDVGKGLDEVLDAPILRYLIDACSRQSREEEAKWSNLTE